MDYKPSSSLETAHKRADIIAKIRSFFDKSGVLSVETPILSHAGVTDVYLQSVTAQFIQFDNRQTGYLHTSPEFAMKRILASWHVPIYQITKVFRDNELGHKHNIEFTMLEWYRPQGTLDRLIKELNALINTIFPVDTMFERLSYKQAFLDYACIDPFTATLDDLEQVARFFNIDSSLYREHASHNYMANKTRLTHTNFDVNELLKKLRSQNNESDNLSSNSNSVQTDSSKTPVNSNKPEACNKLDNTNKVTNVSTQTTTHLVNQNAYAFTVPVVETSANTQDSSQESQTEEAFTEIDLDEALPEIAETLQVADIQMSIDKEEVEVSDKTTPTQTSKNNILVNDPLSLIENITATSATDNSELTVSELKEAWLDLLYSHLVEPNLGHAVPTVIYDFPASQASLAKIATDDEGNLVAKRFELYIKGYEIANAYDELSDSSEQRTRFELDNELRSEKGLPSIPIDEHLIQALDDMPDSVGIAVGIDRLVMLACGKTNIAEVISFTTEQS